MEGIGTENRDCFQLSPIPVIFGCSRRDVPGGPSGLQRRFGLWGTAMFDFDLFDANYITTSNNYKSCKSFWLSPGAACNWASSSNQKYANHCALNFEHAHCLHISWESETLNSNHRRLHVDVGHVGHVGREVNVPTAVCAAIRGDFGPSQTGSLLSLAVHEKSLTTSYTFDYLCWQIPKIFSEICFWQAIDLRTVLHDVSMLKFVSAYANDPFQVPIKQLELVVILLYGNPW